MSTLEIIIVASIIVNSVIIFWLICKKEDTEAEIRALKLTLVLPSESASIARDTIWEETEVPKILGRGIGLYETWLTCLEITLASRARKKQDKTKNQCLSCHQRLPKEKP